MSDAVQELPDIDRCQVVSFRLGRNDVAALDVLAEAYGMADRSALLRAIALRHIYGPSAVEELEMMRISVVMDLAGKCFDLRTDLHKQVTELRRERKALRRERREAS